MLANMSFLKWHLPAETTDIRVSFEIICCANIKHFATVFTFGAINDRNWESAWLKLQTKIKTTQLTHSSLILNKENRPKINCPQMVANTIKPYTT